MTGAITIHQTALHAALAELRDRGGEREDTAEAAAFLIDGLNVLTRLLDPYAAIGAAQRAAALPEGRARKLADDTDTAPSATAKAIEDLARFIDDHGACIGCGRVYHADRLRMCDGGEMHCPDCWPGDQKVGETLGTAPAAQPRGTPAPSTIDAQAEPGPSAEAAGAASVAQDADQASPAPSAQATERPLPEPAAADAPPGDQPPHGKASTPARMTATPERIEAIRAMWPDRTFSAKDIMRRMNELPGNPINGTGGVYAVAATAGLPTRRSEIFAEQDAAGGAIAERIAAADKEKAEVFEAFDSGMSVRDAAAEFGLPMSTLANWHAEWKLRAKGAPA